MLDADASRERVDHYRRDALAQRVAHALLRPLGTDSLVVVLDGPWGSGKTWLLEKVAEQLKAHAENPTHVVRFNPWQIAEESDLILDFLVQLALELSPGKSAQKSVTAASRKLLKYAKVLSYGKYLKYVPIPGVDTLGTAVEDLTESASEAIEKAEQVLEEPSRPSLSQARREVNDAIAGLGKRVIVLIDDVDRLRSREVRAVMQLVKSVADFPQTSFLLAFDAEHVAKAVAEDGHVDTGMRYLEKIIQLSIPVPWVDKRLLLSEVRERLTDALSSSGHAVKPYERVLMDDATKLVAVLCDTPRDVVRWANHLAWAAAALRGSVNMADLCVVEALRIKADRTTWALLISSRILDQPEADLDIGTQGWRMWAGWNKETKQAELAAIRSGFASQALFSALSFLFPQVARDKADGVLNAQEYRRVSSPVVWSHYRRFGTGREQVTGAQVENWLQNPSELDAALGNKNADLSEEQIDLLLEIGGFISFDSLPTQADKIKPLVTAICRAGVSPQIERGAFTSSNLASLVEELFLAQASRVGTEELQQLANQLPLSETVLATERLIAFVNSGFSWAEKQEAARQVLPQLKPLVLGRLHQAINDASLLRERDRVYLAHAYSRLELPSKAAGMLARLVATDDALRSLIQELADRPADYFPSVLLLDLFPDPTAFIERVRSLNDARFSGYLSFLESVPPDRLANIQNYYAKILAVTEATPEVAPDEPPPKE